MTNTSSSSNNTTSHKLHNISQTIHATLLSPPAQFLLVCTISGRQWCLSLFSTTKDVTRVWVTEKPLNEVKNDEESIFEAITQGLLHANCGSRRQVDISRLKTIDLHILTPPDPLLYTLTAGDIEEHIPKLLGATYQLLSRPALVAKRNGNPDADIRELKLQLSQKDAEISSLNSRLSSLKATVVRATASDVNKKKVQQSPQKARPLPGASQLQPNQKRRKVVEDEFAGSSSDED
ncbi:hypothetical protein I302_100809 [Kwoniella bestiolae CBS 10118]|uniref:Uncharacterized protein n=1 Tax=Kwoniella bestiolae CBS 10118 TaxID=1296100 RepID=A0AAJ8K0S2_9TREE